MIRSFRDKRCEALYRGERCPELQSTRKVALRKLDMLAAARRINDRWGLYFIWDEGADAVEVVDYY